MSVFTRVFPRPQIAATGMFVAAVAMVAGPLLANATASATATAVAAPALIAVYTAPAATATKVSLPALPESKPTGTIPTGVLPPVPPEAAAAPADTSPYSDIGTADVPQSQRENAAYVWDELRKAGYSEAGAAGVLGNLQQESNINPKAPGGGIAQWINGRWSADYGVLGWTAKNGYDPYSLKGQTAYMIWDIGKTSSTTGGTLSSYLKRTSDPVDAADVFQLSFERAGMPMQENRNRYATAWYKTFSTTKSR